MLALLGVSIIWGTSFLVIKEILLHVSALTYLSLRFGLAVLLLLLWHRQALFHPKGIFLKEGVLLGLLLSGVYLLTTFGVAETSASNATFISNLFIIFTPFVEVVILKKKLERKYLYASVLGILGFLFISGVSDLTFNMGDFAILMSALILSVHLLCTEHFTKKRPVHSLVITQSFVVFIISLVLGISTNSLQISFVPEVYILTFYLALFSTIIAFETIARAEKYIESTQTAIVISFQGIWALLFALGLGIETLTFHKTLGVVFMTLALIVAEIKMRQPHNS